MKRMAELNNVSKSFCDERTGRSIFVLENISLSINEGEILALLGPNGSGKSTLLRLIVGLDRPDSGEITFPPGVEQFRAELMFQDFRSTFLPWFSLCQNLIFPFRKSGANGAIALSTLRTLVGDLDFDAFPRTVSGGELQAAALARSVSRTVNILLLDEPFSSLDVAVRNRALTVCHEAVESGRASALILVTHNLEDVAALADRVVVMRSHPGKVVSEFLLSDACDYTGSRNFSASMEQLRAKVHEALTR